MIVTSHVPWASGSTILVEAPCLLEHPRIPGIVVLAVEIGMNTFFKGVVLSEGHPEFTIGALIVDELADWRPLHGSIALANKVL